MYSNMETEANSQAINPEFHQMFIRFEKTIEESISLGKFYYLRNYTVHAFI